MKNSTTTAVRTNTDALISVVIPAHNESAGISNAVSIISSAVEQCSKRFEIIIIDDGSDDEMFDIVTELAIQDSRVQGIRLSRNFGKEAALLCGLQAAIGDVVITIDSDLQHPPTLIYEMMEKWQQGALIVHAIKRSRKNDSLIAKARAYMFNRAISWLAKIDLNNSSDFKLLDRIIVDTLANRLPERNRLYRGLASWVGYPSEFVEFDVNPRSNGEGQWSMFGLIELAITTVVSFTSAPLRIVTILGFMTALLGFIVGTDAAISWFRGQAVSGFATLIITILIIGSFIMISLGILGEYVANIYDEIKQRPVYFVAETVGFETEADAKNNLD
jgi:glycosyltransferase involved in cell wall biosynthesis